MNIGSSPQGFWNALTILRQKRSDAGGRQDYKPVSLNGLNLGLLRVRPNGVITYKSTSCIP